MDKTKRQHYINAIAELTNENSTNFMSDGEMLDLFFEASDEATFKRVITAIVKEEG